MLADTGVVPIAIVGRSLVFLSSHIYGPYCLPNVLCIGRALTAEPVDPWFVLGVMACLIGSTEDIFELASRSGDKVDACFLGSGPGGANDL